MDSADLAVIMPSLTESPLARGKVLFECDDIPAQVYFPSSAVLSVVTVMEDGRSVESSTIGHESATPLLAVLAGQPMPHRVFTQIAGGAIRAPAAILRARATESPSFLRLLLSHIQAATQQAEQGVACNVLHDAPARLARWLLMTEDRLGAPVLPLTQEYMAVMTGVQRTTISLVANTLRSKGLIGFSRGAVEILDRPGLEQAACECYATVRSHLERLSAPRAEVA
jgi:CRP-like cAMP-binding protein